MKNNFKQSLNKYLVCHNYVYVCVSTYLPADSEEGVAGGVHENDLALSASRVIINAKDQIALGIKHRKAITVEQQGFLPHG